nr:MAG TPA: hypothetical protein [Caudoviricetes sp.]
MVAPVRYLSLCRRFFAVESRLPKDRKERTRWQVKNHV